MCLLLLRKSKRFQNDYYGKVGLEKKKEPSKQKSLFLVFLRPSLAMIIDLYMLHDVYRPCNILKDFMARVGYPIRDSIPFLIGLHSADQINPERTSTLFNSRGVTGMCMAIHRGAYALLPLSTYLCAHMLRAYENVFAIHMHCFPFP